MQTTANYGLKKPEGNDTVDIDVINGNMDSIDGELKKRMLSNEFSVSGTPLTTEKSNIIGMVNELFTNVDNGQSNVYSAIVGKGTTPASKQFSDLVAGINAIARGQGNAVESQVRAGVKFSNSDGTLRTGTLPVQVTSAQTITPGTNDIVKGAGIYDGAITIKGDSNLVSGNIKAGTNIFGVNGKSSVVDTADATAITSDKILNGYSAYANGSKVSGNAQAKINNGTFFVNLPQGYFSIGYDDESGLLWAYGSNVEDSHAYGFDQNGTLIKTITISIPYMIINYVCPGYMLWNGFNYDSTSYILTDKTGTIIRKFSVMKNQSEFGAAINPVKGYVYLPYQGNTNTDFMISIYNINGTYLDYQLSSFLIVRIIPISIGILVFTTSGMFLIRSNGNSSPCSNLETYFVNALTY